MHVDGGAYAPLDQLSGKIPPYQTIRRGDNVVFRDRVDGKRNYIKRVVGLPGDRIDLENKDVWRNGVKLEEKYVQHIFPPNFYRE